MKRRFTLLATPVLIAALLSPSLAAAAEVPPASILAQQRDSMLAPGLVLTRFERLYPTGWVNGHLLTVDLTSPAIYTDLVSAPSVTSAEPLSVIAQRAGAIAAVNGDFFDINNTKMPLGPVVQGGQMLKSGPAGWNAAGVSLERIGRLMEVALEGKVTLPTGTHRLTNINQYTVSENGIGLYSALWTARRDGAAFGASEVREVQIGPDGRVLSVRTATGTGPIPEGHTVLVGREAGALALASLKPGDPVSVQVAPRAGGQSKLQFAVGGQEVLLKGGSPMAVDDKKVGPRTAIGFSADGKRMFLLAVDGRSEQSAGLTLLQVAHLMRSFGAADALNLDGGGSTEMVARTPNQAAVSVLNQPSDGVERRIPNGVGVFLAPGSGKVTGLAVRPASDAEHADRLFPGLHRRLTATGHDERLAPAAAGPITWRSAPATFGTLSPDGLFTATKPGTALVTAASGAVKGELSLTVLGPLARLGSDVPGLRLEAGQSAAFTVLGFDADGYSAPIDPADVSLEYDTELLRIEPSAGGFRAMGLKEGSGQVRLRVQEKELALPATVGYITTKAVDFDALAPWTFQKHPASVTGNVELAVGYNRLGLKLQYTFGPGATRAAYAEAAQPIALPGRPERIGLWVKGDGNGAWLRANLVDASGAPRTIDLARNVNWTGWQYVEAAVPRNLTYPVSLSRIYPVETAEERQYSGQLILDDLVVKEGLVAPAETAVTEAVDPLTVQELSGLKFGFLHGTRLSSGDPASVERTRQALQQVRAADLQFLLIGGDFVASDSREDLALASRLLREEVKVPVHYLPGDGERGADMVNYMSLFGLGRFSTDIGSTRLIGLDSSAKGLWFQGLQDLRAKLDKAASDPKVSRVVLAASQMPTGFGDHREGAMVERWLTEFRARTGKEVIYLSGGAGEPSVRRVEGVTFLQVGRPGVPVLFGSGNHE